MVCYISIFVCPRVFKSSLNCSVIHSNSFLFCDCIFYPYFIILCSKIKSETSQSLKVLLSDSKAINSFAVPLLESCFISCISSISGLESKVGVLLTLLCYLQAIFLSYFNIPSYTEMNGIWLYPPLLLVAVILSQLPASVVH